MIKREFLYLGLYLLLCIPIVIIYIKFSVRAKREWLTLVGRTRQDIPPDEQKREYIRLESTFPVEFQKVEEPEKRQFDVHQGVTRNISKTGMAIETLMVRGKMIEDLIPNKTKLKLIINIPAEAQATVAQATVKWIRKIEDIAVDRYLIGVSYDDIAEPDLAKIIKYAMWFRKKPDILGITVVIILMLIAVFFSAALLFRDTKVQLEGKVRSLEEEKLKLAGEAQAARKDKEEAVKDLETITEKYTTLQEKVKGMEREWEYQRKRFAEVERKKTLLEGEIEEITVTEEIEEEKALPKTEETELKAETVETEETLEPIVEVRRPVTPEVAPGDEIIVKPNITRSMIDSEKEIYKTLRNYILEEELQLLDRYASGHRTSIYHAASLFALAEMRYKNSHIKEMTMKAYRDVIRLYPRSKYASYASHRLDQIARNLPYGSYSLRYYYVEYNLPPLFDYRELEPYKE